MIALRKLIPNSVTKPTIEPSEITAPVAATASTPPTKAKGRFTSTRTRLRTDPVTTASSSTMPRPASAE